MFWWTSRLRDYMELARKQNEYIAKLLSSQGRLTEIVEAQRAEIARLLEELEKKNSE